MNESQSTYQKDETFNDILKYLKFSINLMSATLYGVEKAKNFPIVAANALGTPDDVTDELKYKASTVRDIFSYASYGITLSEFFDPIFREKGKFLWIEFKEDSQEARRNFTIVTFVVVVISILGVGYIYWDDLKPHKALLDKKKKQWKKPLSLATNGFKFLGGIIQLITIFQNSKNFEQRKLFTASSVALSLTSPLEMYGIDKLLFRVDPEGIAYVVAYGLRTTLQITQSVGMLTKED